MRFDYNVGTEATFYDWEREGCEKAKAILNALECGAEKKQDVENDKASELSR